MDDCFFSFLLHLTRQKRPSSLCTHPCKELKFQGNSGTTLEHKEKAWWIDKVVCLYSAFPSFFTYAIWWERNTVTFNNKFTTHEVISGIVIQWTREQRSQVKEEKVRVPVSPTINKKIPWDFFRWSKPRGSPTGWFRRSTLLSKKIEYPNQICTRPLYKQQG